ncbi:hypothetical protein CFE70_008410 [Pyrenophora teres f. teres 0-1]|uniref:Uncharacterized protein n=2 Tax=Pyrenophora teres f. teres TaxID=97479 RepID=E3RZP4_PYRTT|nr:hypothetical protein PTT_15146 [Pyrenophora teres f. teres 0-1]KAE8829123.1 hypothetical protein PTNB85_08311 [Pyrenophora teres f. teres]CAA9964558.1 hypothetical protein PTMSG1_07917 [Pyrenophora teres f. maculata]KAE8830285.1 hypothetical protein HRS9139_06909 [Pyrenophora teres f. teres]KAE8841375.1 hypothetical protein HRS9122_05501 [Pyrenophora teres f. teres]
MDAGTAQTAGHALLTAVNDLNAAVDASPEDITTEILRATQSVVSKMQKAVRHMNAPHPKFEAELQEEIAKVEPRIAQGTVTKAEADHLHSLEARAHGHTEKGGVAAAAQSIAARRERQLSLSSASGSVTSLTSGRSRANSRNFTLSLRPVDAPNMPKIGKDTVTLEKPDTSQSHEASADKGGSLNHVSNTSSHPVETDPEHPKEDFVNEQDVGETEKP